MITIQKETEKREALDKLSYDKDAEIRAACKGWEDKVAQLQQEVFKFTFVFQMQKGNHTKKILKKSNNSKFSDNGHYKQAFATEKPN